MKSEVKVKDIFVHGRTRYEPGMKNPSFTTGDARDLEARGLVEIIGESAVPAAAKAETAPQNKMADATANKGEARPAKAK